MGRPISDLGDLTLDKKLLDNPCTAQIYFKIQRNWVLEIREREKNIDIRMEITDSWDDHRISFSPEYTKIIKPSESPDITINWYDTTKENQNIWYPDGNE